MNSASEPVIAPGAWQAPPPPPLGDCSVHVWRIRLDDPRAADRGWPTLSADEQERAGRFHFDAHRQAFVVSHAALRAILGAYANMPAGALAFSVGEFGKPSLASAPDADPAHLEFNLSHSGDIALVAVARGRLVGVDVEQWNAKIEHLDLADHFFSPGERRALRTLAHAEERVVAGFFAAWSRKEAYLKASGHGITRGLHHFDVSLVPGEPAQLLADQSDADASDRWTMWSLEPGAGYSGALVVAAPVHEVLLFDLPAT